MPPDSLGFLSKLLQAATIFDHEEVLRNAIAALQDNQRDNIVQHIQIVALLKLDRFDNALSVIYESGKRLESRCVLEKAYALYKLGRLDEAAFALESHGLGERSLQHVAAQVAYRAERFVKANAIYRLLGGSDAACECNDLSINVSATEAQTEWQGFSNASTLLLEPLSDTFELCYNMACAHLARGSYKTANKLLQRAAELCNASDDMTEEEKKAESMPIMAQQAYVYTLLGDTEKSIPLYQSLVTSRDTETEAVLVAKNNQSILETEGDEPFLLQRRLAISASPATDFGLFSYQSNMLTFNLSVAEIRAHKTGGVRDRTDRILKQSKQPTTRQDINLLSVVNVAARTRRWCGQKLLRKVVKLSKKYPTNVGFAITTTQLYLRDKNVEAALSALELLLDCLEISTEEDDRRVRFSPGLTALAISLLRARGREASAKAELLKAATYWRERPLASAASLVREAYLELVKSSSSAHLAVAASALQRLHEQERSSPLVSTGLVAALAMSDGSRIEGQVLTDLPAVWGLIGDTDVHALAGRGFAMVLACNVTTQRQSDISESTGERVIKKRKRHGKMPKNSVEGMVPDAERWMPLRDRTTYRSRGRKSKKKGADSIQGGVIREEETLELVGGGGVKVEKTPAVGSANKKKKKSRK
ncbi:hypothetical protein CDD83_1073 [Cordyceps sp. RAO-2017]|nr:hypothetical protein CDD83_1073 [Cordyceps sp. RAO-2017]